MTLEPGPTINLFNATLLEVLGDSSVDELVKRLPSYEALPRLLKMLSSDPVESALGLAPFVRVKRGRLGWRDGTAPGLRWWRILLMPFLAPIGIFFTGDVMLPQLNGVQVDCDQAKRIGRSQLHRD